MGILAMNIVAFAMPFQAYMNPTAYGLESDADLASWVFSFVLDRRQDARPLLLPVRRQHPAGRSSGPRAAGESPAPGPLSRACSGCSSSACSISTSSGSATSSPLYALTGLIALLLPQSLGAGAGHLGRRRSSCVQMPADGAAARWRCYLRRRPRRAPNPDRRGWSSSIGDAGTASRRSPAPELADESGPVSAAPWSGLVHDRLIERGCSSRSGSSSSSAGDARPTCCSAWRR